MPAFLRGLRPKGNNPHFGSCPIFPDMQEKRVLNKLSSLIRSFGSIFMLAVILSVIAAIVGAVYVMFVDPATPIEHVTREIALPS